MGGIKGRSAVRLCVACCLLVLGAGGSRAAGAALPDGRAYELVTPPAKNGADVMPVPSRTRAAVSGNAVEFSSLTSLPDVLGMSVSAEYVSVRDGRVGTNGWATHSIMPKLDAFSSDTVLLGGYNSTYMGEMSDDLSHGIFRTGTNLSGDPHLGTIANLYLRPDLLSPGAGSYLTVTACPACTAPFSAGQQANFAWPADATPDFGHVLFETPLNLVAGASGTHLKLYEWDHGVVRLAGILPASRGGGMALTSIAGNGARAGLYTLRTISDDGRRIFFTDDSATGAAAGVLYMRVDHATTIQLNASERTDCADHNPCNGTPEPDPVGPQSATFQTASADGTKVFFTSPEALTDAPSGGLYLYDASIPDSDAHNLTRIATSVIGVIGASADGSYVYFLSTDQLIPGRPLTNGGAGIYVWHAGTLRLIGTLTTYSLDNFFDSLGSPWDLNQLTSRVTPDGSHLLFLSHSGDGLTGYNQSGCSGGCGELYAYSYAADSLACASCNPTGAPATTSADFNTEIGRAAASDTSHLNHPLSDDGRYVFFTTAERLVSEDRNNVDDVYEYDTSTGQLHLISSGQSPDDSFFLDASANGHDVFFATRERLVGWDTDTAYDIYDARVGGGFPEPPPAAPECAGDTCQGSPGAAPSDLSSPTGAPFSGNDNVRHVKKPKAKRCKRGTTRERIHGKVRCVKTRRVRRGGR